MNGGTTVGFIIGTLVLGILIQAFGFPMLAFIALLYAWAYSK